MSPIDIDSNGYPVMLADVVVAEKPSAPTKPAPTTKTPQGVDGQEWARRTDAVREAAREFESFTSQDVTEHLRGRTLRDLTPAEIESFVADVRAQVISDLVDILDQRERGILRGRRYVRVHAPKGYTVKVMRSLEDAEVAQISDRLKARGWSDKQLKTFKDRLPEQQQKLAERVSGSSTIALTEKDVAVIDNAPGGWVVERDDRGFIKSFHPVDDAR